MRTVALLLALLVALGVALQHFGYGAAHRPLAAAVSAGQAEDERALTLLDVWAQAVVPSMLLEQSRARAVATGDRRLAARLARRLRAGLRRARGFEAQLARDPVLRGRDSVDARALHDAAAAWHDWAAALLAPPGPPPDRAARRIGALEARAVRLHQAAYAVVDTSLRTAVARP